MCCQVITTDAVPVRLQYVRHLDQVWVVCWNDVNGAGSRSVIIIREASKGKRHGIVHPQSVTGGLDQVSPQIVTSRVISQTHKIKNVSVCFCGSWFTTSTNRWQV